ncbi:MAG: glycosyltransferase family 2 protein [Chloroflexi bacterium]|nr:glycosyltransferase family 2 protein [Chloroflexota bacterium]
MNQLDAAPSTSRLETTTHVLAAVPCYNEERFIGSVVLKIRHYVDKVLVVDDGSADATSLVAEAAGAVVMRHAKNSGKAEALNTAFSAARALGVDVLVLLDGDGQHRPEEIPQLVEALLADKADIVIGSRFLADAAGSIPVVRRAGQQLLTTAANIGSGVQVSDSQSGFRVFSRRAIEALTFRERGFSVEAEMQFLAAEYGLRVVERPITAVYADPPKRNVFGQGVTVLNGILRLIGQHRPLLYFGVPGALLFVLGMLLGAYVVQLYAQTGQLATGYAVLTVLLAEMGLLSLFAGLLLHSIRAFMYDLKEEFRHR